jgi:hypothetical protein
MDTNHKAGPKQPAQRPGPTFLPYRTPRALPCFAGRRHCTAPVGRPTFPPRGSAGQTPHSGSLFLFTLRAERVRHGPAALRRFPPRPAAPPPPATVSMQLYAEPSPPRAAQRCSVPSPVPPRLHPPHSVFSHRIPQLATADRVAVCRVRAGVTAGHGSTFTAPSCSQRNYFPEFSPARTPRFHLLHGNQNSRHAPVQ